MFLFNLCGDLYKYYLNLNNMYLVIIEPIYSQSVGNYVLVTKNVQHINKIRRELEKYKDYVMKELDDIDEWQFDESVDKITEITIKDDYVNYKGYNLFLKRNVGNYKFEESSYDDNENNKNDKKIVNIFSNGKILKTDYVYDFIDNSNKPIHVNQFTLLKNKN